MAFCEKCGAYLPIGETVCTACGYDPEAEARQKAEAERRAEEERQAEEVRRAKEEAHRREQERREAEEAQKRAERERWEQQKAKWQSDADKYKYKYSTGGSTATQGEYSSHKSGAKQENWTPPWQSGGASDPRYETYRQQAAQSVSRQKLSILSYIGFLFIIPYLTQKGDDFARYHANQGFVLFLASAALQLVGKRIGLIGLAGGAFTLFCMVKGISNVLRGKKDPLPLIGGIDLLK